MIRKANRNDITGWMALVEKVKDTFPGLETKEALAEHEKTVLKLMDRETAICAEDRGRITGLLLYSKTRNMICFLAVDPEYRRKKFASAMLTMALNDLDFRRDVTLSTFIESDESAPAARGLYEGFGFKAGMITEEYGSPVQVYTRKTRIIDKELALVFVYPNEEITLPWYQDERLVKLVDNSDRLYDSKRLARMYHYLSTRGDCFYICLNKELVGDCALYNGNELAIVIAPSYQNRHIGRRCIDELVRLAKEKGLSTVKAEIYPFNTQSQTMFAHAGFHKDRDDWYVRPI